MSFLTIIKIYTSVFSNLLRSFNIWIVWDTMVCQVYTFFFKLVLNWIGIFGIKIFAYEKAKIFQLFYKNHFNFPYCAMLPLWSDGTFVLSWAFGLQLAAVRNVTERNSLSPMAGRMSKRNDGDCFSLGTTAYMLLLLHPERHMLCMLCCSCTMV